MFQFDAGTYDDTIARYGSDIVTVEGNTAAVVPFLVERAIQSVDGVSSEEDALSWMNAVPVQDGDPEFEAWLYFVAWRYNGCMGCTSVQEKYRKATHEVMDEFGAEFWSEAGEVPSCDKVPPAGRLLEENERCFRGGGNPTYWRSESAGHGGGLRWTLTTDSEVIDNYGVWTFDFVKAGEYEVLVYTDGGTYGQSSAANYEIVHGGTTDTVVIDQTTVDGFQSLGVFDFAAGPEQHVRLNDNTGEPYAEDGTRLMFDAVSVKPPGDDEPDKPGEEEPDVPGGALGGCSTTGSQPSLWMLLALGLFARRRARPRR